MVRMQGIGVQHYRATCAVLLAGIAGFAVAVAVGWLEVRRPGLPADPTAKEEVPSPLAGPYVQRSKAAEALAWEQKPMAVYRFAGGVPDCWAEIDSEGHKRTLGPWRAIESLLYAGTDPLDRPIPESVEGYVALLGPTTAEQTYRLRVGVTKVKYPENPKRQSQLGGFHNEVRVTLPALLPGPKRPLTGSTSEAGEERQPVLPGQDVLLSFNAVETPGGKECSVRLLLRFNTPEDLAAVNR